MKKSSPLVIMVPLFVGAAVIGGILFYRSFTQVGGSPVLTTPATVPSLQGSAGSPQSGFTVGKTGDVSPVSDLSQQLNAVKDDAADSDFQALQSNAAQL